MNISDSFLILVASTIVFYAIALWLDGEDDE